MKKRIFTPQEESEIIDYYQTPFTLSETARHFNLINTQVKDIISRNNVSFHSSELNKQARLKKTQQTCLDRYGVKNTFRSKQAAKNRNLAYASRSADIVAKVKETKLKRYGNANYNNSDQIAKTRKEKYGVENFFQCEEIHKKALINAAKDSSKEKKKITCQQHFGVDYSLQAKEVRNKIKETCESKYGAPYIKLTAEQTEIKNTRSVETIRKKYGVDYACQTENCIKACRSNNSQPNKTFSDKLEEYNIPYKKEYPLGKKLFDFKVNSRLVEINPSATHNSTWGIRSQKGLPRNYHIKKSELAEQNGFQCIHVWDWDNTKAVLHMLETKDSFGARECEVKIVDEPAAAAFLNEYHCQGYVKATISLGLYLENDLQAIMTFGKPRYNKSCEYELLRYCSKNNIMGGAEKLFKFFIGKYSPMSVVSYCDRSKFSGTVYQRLGFQFVRTSEPRRHWYNIKTKQHITDNLLKQRGFDQLFGTNYGKGTNNTQLMLDHNFVEVYDCGQATYIWKNSQNSFYK